MDYYKEVKKPNRIIGKTLFSVIRKYLNFKIDIHLEENETKDLKPPYLILANHVTYWDPFLVNLFINEPICYIAESVYFRNPILRFFLNLAGSIPKKRFVSHYSPIKRMIRAKENGRILGVFPEGERKWDGTTNELILHSTSKLIKKLNVPVVIAKIKGGYLAYPRWARAPRRGRVSLSYQVCITGNEVQELAVQEIAKKVKKFFFHDEMNYQKEYLNTYLGDHLAEHLEHLLFACPHCKSFNTLVSHENVLYCAQCNYRVIYNQYGFLKGLQKKLYFDNVRDWNRWQNRFLKDYIMRKLTEDDQGILLEDENVELLEGSFTKPFMSIGLGRLSLKQMKIFFTVFEGKKYQFELKKITGMNVQFHAVLEFGYNEDIFRFIFKNQHISAYKWVQAVHYLKNEVFNIAKQSVG
ncbi:MAG: 1-acyl-sn-glycerol-3-phosphate acyltransferase [Candidatus Atribacteria bacterium]|nr:1-acyl-sn-glycerol-3-phosphate acyltransferase [Candidatus Atribacteria bacterium]